MWFKIPQISWVKIWKMRVEKPIKWDPDKNNLLIEQRGLSFEAIVIAMERGGLISAYPHPKRQNQKIFEVEIDGYVVVVPYVEDDEKIFFKTAFHSRKANKSSRKGENND
jgi:uncharacterized DUF497 family protein